MRGSDEKVWIQNPIVTVENIVRRHWVHVVDDDPVMDVIAFDTQITTVVTSNDKLANMSPLT